MLFSIITVNRNNSDGLERTIESVRSLKKKNFEYIVIDGASTDNSVDVIKKNSDCIDFYISEPDKGIYNAMNKGIGYAKGDYVIFMNSGDRFLNGDVLEMVEKENLYADFVFCGWMRGKDGIALSENFPDNHITLYKLLYQSDCISHQSTFTKRETLLELGKYDDSLVICADVCFIMIALALNDKTYQTINKTISIFDITGFSGSPKGLEILNHEKFLYFKNKFPYIYDDYVYLHKRIRFTWPNIKRYLKWRFSKDR